MQAPAGAGTPAKTVRTTVQAHRGTAAPRRPVRLPRQPPAAPMPTALLRPRRQPIDPIVVNAVLIAVRQAANVLCDRWTLLILLSAHCGTTRFADFRERCGGVATRLLSTRLAMLEEQEVMVRLAYTRRPLRHGYHLSHMGLALFDVLAALLQWERRWHPDASGPGLSLAHLACGAQAVAPAMRCAFCGEAVLPRHVSLKISQKEIRQMPQRATAYRRSTHSAASRGPADRLPLPHGIDIFGDKWSIEVLMCAFVRVNTFGGFQAHTGMSTNILADRLARLTAAGIFSQAPKSAHGGAYRLTDKGLDLFPVLVCIETWADAWLRERARSPLRLVHAGCGQPLRMAVQCSGCGVALAVQACSLRVA